jgi:hypothetical protein
MLSDPAEAKSKILLSERYFLLTEKIKLMMKKGKFENALKLCQEENYRSFDEIA